MHVMNRRRKSLLQYDLKTGARIPMQIEATEGTVLSQKAETTDVVDPITLTVKKMTDAELVSSTTIVDLEGGTPLPSQRT